MRCMKLSFTSPCKFCFEENKSKMGEGIYSEVRFSFCEVLKIVDFLKAKQIISFEDVKFNLQSKLNSHRSMNGSRNILIDQ